VPPPDELTNPGRAIGLDVGARRLGVALSDETQTLAFPHATVAVSGEHEIPSAVEKILQKEPAVEVVVGLPLSLDGGTGPQALNVERVAEKLRRRLNLPVHVWDERLSTQEARRLRHESGRRDDRGLDATAAAVILQDYLDWKRNQPRRTSA
jgi:putative Holliday junction resolvase